MSTPRLWSFEVEEESGNKVWVTLDLNKVIACWTDSDDILHIETSGDDYITDSIDELDFIRLWGSSQLVFDNTGSN